MVYLGTLGRMIELKCPSSQQLQIEDGLSFQSTLEGRRVAQAPASRGRRTWSCQLSDASTPGQIGAVMSFINGEWGNGPFTFVSADAPVTNMLSPAVAACSPTENPSIIISSTGPMRIGDDLLAGSSYSSPDPALTMFFGQHAPGAERAGQRVPVRAGGSVTASAYVTGPEAYCRVSFYSDTDALISSANSAVLASDGIVVRSWAGAVAPPGAAWCRVFAINTVQAARPAITWSDTLLEWADGQGCTQAVIHGASRDLIMASREPRGGRYSNLSFTITEVG